MTHAPSGRPTLSGTDLHDLFTAAHAWLERNADAVNAVNVFPVPDGDTGTNMSLTLSAAVAGARRAGHGVPEVMGELAHGALMGARGNSGVILSQYLRGIADVLIQATTVDAGALARALVAGADTASAAVAKPVEGTILTAAREAGRSASAVVQHGDIESVWQAAVDGAREAVRRSPELLPVLRDAGVVDSGALGLSIALEGGLHFLRGETLPDAPINAGSISDSWLQERAGAHASGDGRFGYCVEFGLRGDALQLDALRSDLQALGESVLVVGDPALAHIHVHTDDPGAALQHGTGRGILVQIKIDNMDEQANRLVRSAPAEETFQAPFAVVAVAAGEGLVSALRGAGAAAIVTGGQTMNPSTADLLAAIDAAPSTHVAVLPNNKNIIWTAEQAARLSSKTVRVVPTRSVPQGIAALLAVNAEQSPDEAVSAMTVAFGGVHTIDVTRAARPARVGAREVQEGTPISLIDDELTGTGETPDDAAMDALGALHPHDDALITVYWGATIGRDSAERFAERIRGVLTSGDVEVVEGGQPFYDYVISVE